MSKTNPTPRGIAKRFSDDPIAQQPVAQLPWGHVVVTQLPYAGNGCSRYNRTPGGKL